jgi:hypothetical protein
MKRRFNFGWIDDFIDEWYPLILFMIAVVFVLAVVIRLAVTNDEEKSRQNNHRLKVNRDNIKNGCHSGISKLILVEENIVVVCKDGSHYTIHS